MSEKWTDDGNSEFGDGTIISDEINKMCIESDELAKHFTEVVKHISETKIKLIETGDSEPDKKAELHRMCEKRDDILKRMGKLNKRIEEMVHVEIMNTNSESSESTALRAKLYRSVKEHAYLTKRIEELEMAQRLELDELLGRYNQYLNKARNDIRTQRG